MRRLVSIIGLLVLVVVVVFACGGTGGGDAGERSDSPEAETTRTDTGAAARPLPGEDYIPAGKYRSTKFEPALTVSVDGRWLAIQIPGTVVFIKEEEQLQVAFIRVKKVFDPSSPGGEVQRPAPESVDGWIDWLRDHPNLDTEKPAPATVGGVTGRRIDLVVSNIPEDYPEECEEPCVPGYSTADERGVFDYVLGEKDRAIVLDVEGETVLVTITAPDEKFEKVLPRAKQLLDTVRWSA